jgi:hypothetical protein
MAVRRLTRLEQVLFVVAAGVIGMYFFLGKVWDPMTAKMKTTIVEHNKIVSALNQLQETPLGCDSEKREIERLEPLIAGEKERLQRLRDADVVRGDEELREYEMLLNKVARSNNIVIQDFTRLEKTLNTHEAFVQLQRDVGDLDRNAYSLTASGNYMDFIGFLHGLTRLPKEVNLTAIDLNAEKAGTGIVRIQAVVVI